MYEFTNDSDFVIIVLHEIYGINEHIKKVCEEYSRAGYDVLCPNLIKRKPFSYTFKRDAYQHFINKIGFDAALQQVKELAHKAKKKYKQVFIAGYSIGATISWMCSGQNGLCDGVVGYYGSRIRDYLDIDPKCPVLMIFSTEEELFKEKEVIDLLIKKQVRVYVLNGKHGFCDSFSSSYSKKQSEESKALSDNFIREICLL